MCTHSRTHTNTHVCVHTRIHANRDLTKVNNMAIKDKQTTENLDIKIKKL